MNRRRFQFDDDAQVDGDASGAANFHAPSLGTPWLRGGMPPWHMWGGSVEMTIDSVGLDPDHPSLNAQQVVRINYKRPETWSFFFGARLLGSTPTTGGVFIAVVFDLLLGTGRSVFQTLQPIATNPFNTLGFCKLLWSLNPGDVPLAQPSKYTTRVNSPPLDDRDATSVQPIEWVGAQDIQVGVRMIVLPVLVPTPFVYRAEAHAYFAPRTHVRPDWMQEGPPEMQFQGSEIGGT